MLLFSILRTFFYILIIYNKDFGNSDTNLTGNSDDNQETTEGVLNSLDSSPQNQFNQQSESPGSSEDISEDNVTENQNVTSHSLNQSDTETTTLCNSEYQETESSFRVSYSTTLSESCGKEDSFFVSDDSSSGVDSSLCFNGSLSTDGHHDTVKPRDTQENGLVLPTHSSRPGPFSPNSFEFLTSDDTNGNNPKTIDTSKYVLKDYYARFVCNFKSGTKCFLIKHNNQVLWKYDQTLHENHFPRSLEVSGVRKTAVVKIDDEWYYTYEYTNETWRWDLCRSKGYLNTINPTQSTFGFKVITVNNKGYGYKVNDKTQYEVFSYPDTDAFLYKLKDGAKCVRFKILNVTLWRYDPSSNGGSFPIAFYINKYKGTFIAYFPNNISNVYGYVYLVDPQTDRIIFHVTSGSSRERSFTHFYPSNFKIVTADDAYGRNLKFNDTTQYRLYSFAYHQAVLFLFNDQAKCIEFKHKGNTVWKHNLVEDKDKFPRLIQIVCTKGLIYVQFETHFYVYKYDNYQWKLNENLSLKSMLLLRVQYPSEIKIITQEGEDPNNTKENDGDGYNVLKFTQCDTYLYAFSQNTKCVEIKYNNEKIWKYDEEEYKDKYPKTIYYNSFKKSIVIEFDVYWYYTFELIEGSWILNQSQTKKLESIPSPKFTVNDFSVVTLDGVEGSSTKVNDTTKYERFDFKHIQSSLYVFKNETKCVKFKCKNSEIWEHDSRDHPDVFPKTIEVDFVEGVVVVKFDGEWFYRYKFSNDNWVLENQKIKRRSLKTNPINELITLDIKNKLTTDQYEYLKDGSSKVETYTAKSGYKFEKIKKGNVDLWSPLDKRKSDKIEVDYNETGKIKLIIDLGDGNKVNLILDDAENDNKENESDVLDVSQNLDVSATEVLSLTGDSFMNYDPGSVYSCDLI